MLGIDKRPKKWAYLVQLIFAALRVEDGGLVTIVAEVTGGNETITP